MSAFESLFTPVLPPPRRASLSPTVSPSSLRHVEHQFNSKMLFARGGGGDVDVCKATLSDRVFPSFPPRGAGGGGGGNEQVRLGYDYYEHEAR